MGGRTARRRARPASGAAANAHRAFRLRGDRERPEGAAVPERDGYIAGVPCWIDTTQPDPDAAADFYRGVFGWEFEDMMPPGAPGKYFMARLRGGDVAAVSSQPEGSPPMATWNTYVW